MNTSSSPGQENLRQFFKALNRFMLLQWRLGLGPMMNALPPFFGRYMVLTTTGRKTGRKRRTPVNYAVVDGDVYCTAGFGQISDWYRNLKANPQVEVWLPDGWWQGRAEVLEDLPAHLPELRAVLVGSGFAALLGGVDPRKLSDAGLLAAADGYCLMRIRRAAPRTGPDGPGDLVWIWPLAVTLLLPLVLRRRSRRRKLTAE